MKKITLIAAAGLLASGITFAAAAPLAAAPVTAPAMNNWYAGVGINYPSAWTSQNDSHNKLSSKRVGFDVFAGNQLTQNWGIEAGYNHLGNTSYTEDGQSYKVKSVWDLYLDGTATLPFAQYFGVYAQGGMAFLTMKDYSAGGTDPKLNTFAPNYGFGVKFNYQQFGVRAYYNTFILNKTQTDTNNGFGGFKTPATVGLDAMYYFG